MATALTIATLPKEIPANYFDLEGPGTFLILGSASGDLLRQASETLAGHMETLILSGIYRNGECVGKMLGVEAVPLSEVAEGAFFEP